MWDGGGDIRFLTVTTNADDCKLWEPENKKRYQGKEVAERIIEEEKNEPVLQMEQDSLQPGVDIQTKTSWLLEKLLGSIFLVIS